MAKPRRRSWRPPTILRCLYSGRNIVVAVVAACALVAVALVIIVANQSSSGGGVASPTTDPTQQLLAMIPSAEVDDCYTNYRVANAVASANCLLSGAEVSRVEYSLFPDQATLDRYFDDHLGVAQPCPGTVQSPQNWHRAAIPQQTGGRVMCIPSSRVMWTVESQLLVGDAWGPSRESLDHVYQWWANRYQI